MREYLQALRLGIAVSGQAFFFRTARLVAIITVLLLAFSGYHEAVDPPVKRLSGR